jgi:3D (Asp-Asp-Asp) domain-containing protein
VLAFTAGVVAQTVDADSARSGTEGLQRSRATLAWSEQRALLELYASEAALARAQDALRMTDARTALLRLAEASARQRASIARSSLSASHRRVADTLRALYIDGTPDPIAVVLGASSLDEVLAGIEGLQRATAQNRRLVRVAAERASRLSALEARLAGRRAVLETARAAGAVAARQLGQAVGARRSTLASIRNEQRITTRRLAELQAQARAAERLSARITRDAPAAPVPAAAEADAGDDALADVASPAAGAAPDGTRLLVVDVVAYHLPGRTASGLPVGPGIVAVDPTVIPLGTRLFVPGYGTAIAADVGSAVRGNIIDVWMPSRVAALRWGRRTVTITIYG